MPKRAAEAACVHLSLLVTERASVALLLLAADILQRADDMLEPQQRRFTFEFVCSRGPRTFTMAPGITVRAQRPRESYDYLIVPPLADLSAGSSIESDSRDLALIFAQSVMGTVVASACLGSLTLAAAGLLDDREATTHWAWGEFARGRFPFVRWNPRLMISDQRSVITAGGYLAMVDLILHIIARETSTEAADSLRQTLLADRERQRQSPYAPRLLDRAREDEQLLGLEDWIERSLERPIAAEQMARRCNMSLRSFHRRFAAAYRMSPRRFLQLKRLERARELLRDGARSVAQVRSAVGFSDAATFRKLFRREFGDSPTEFRRGNLLVTGR